MPDACSAQVQAGQGAAGEPLPQVPMCAARSLAAGISGRAGPSTYTPTSMLRGGRRHPTPRLQFGQPVTVEQESHLSHAAVYAELRAVTRAASLSAKTSAVLAECAIAVCWLGVGCLPSAPELSAAACRWRCCRLLWTVMVLTALEDTPQMFRELVLSFDSRSAGSSNQLQSEHMPLGCHQFALCCCHFLPPLSYVACLCRIKCRRCE